MKEKKRVKWFRNDRFGMFVHWGLYSIIGRGEWVMSTERIPLKVWFLMLRNSTLLIMTRHIGRRWQKSRHEVCHLNCKHHDGCLFDSKLTDYTSMTSCDRDLVREFVEAVRTEGLKVGLYYSLIDWHHPDYPKYNDINHPMRGNEAFKDEVIDFNNYLRYMHGQVKELVTNYGKLDILWFDYV